MRHRLEQITEDPDRVIEFFFHRERAYGDSFSISEEDNSGYDVLEHPPGDVNNPIIKFAHEMWRTMEQGTPGGAEVPRHLPGTGEPGASFFDDPAWTEGERPIRDELDMPRGDDPRTQKKPAQDGE